MIDQLKRAGFLFDDFGFESLVIQCSRCSGMRGIVIRTRQPTAAKLREALGALKDRHGCTHTEVALS